MRYTYFLMVVVVSFAIGCDNQKKNETKSTTTPTAKTIKTPDTKTKTPTTKVVNTPKTKSGEDVILGLGKTPENIKDGASHVYGARFTIIEKPIALAAAIDKAAKSPGPYKVEANVEKVCQKKGCWFTLKSDGVKIPIRVKMKGYAFFVPRNATGAKAVLEGTFKKTQISKDEAQHYEDDAVKGTGKPAKKVTGPQDTYMFLASAVQISKNKS